MLCNTGDKLVASSNGLLTTVAYQIENQSPVFALEGSVAFAGASVQWLRDNLGLIKKSSDVEKLALEVKDNGDVYFVPAFSGLFSPHWDSSARGTVVGLSRYSNKSHIARAVLESVAYQTDELLRSLELDVGEKENKLLVDGGMVNNNLLMQFQSDISSLQIQAPDIKEVTAFGAALASYVYINKTELKDIPSTKSSQNWNSNMSTESRNLNISKWNKAIEKAKNWI
jgi:glycerol kinase